MKQWVVLKDSLLRWMFCAFGSRGNWLTWVTQNWPLGELEENICQFGRGDMLSEGLAAWRHEPHSEPCGLPSEHWTNICVVRENRFPAGGPGLGW